MTRHLSVFLRPVLAFALLLQAHLAVAQWTDHTSFSQCDKVAVAAGLPVCGNSYGLFYYDESESLLGKLTKVNHLSSVNISAIGSADDYLVVGYSDGDIDLVNLSSLSTTNIPELRVSDVFSQKTINAVASNGSYAYLAFASGVIELNVPKAEIRSTWRISGSGLDVADVCVADGYIYAATSSGVYRADLSSSTLEDPRQWTLLEDPSGDVCAIAVLNGSLYAVVGEKGSECHVWQVDMQNDKAEDFLTVNNFRDLESDGKKLYVTSANSVAVYDSSPALISTIGAVSQSGGGSLVSSPAFRSAYPVSDDLVAIADQNVGLILSNLSSVGHSYCPNGPLSNSSYDIYAVGSDLYATGPGISTSYTSVGNKTTFSVLHNGVWSTSEAENYYSGREPVLFTSDPVSGQVYLSTFGSGVYEIENYELATQYNTSNSNIEVGRNGSAATDAICVDKYRNLYVHNLFTTDGIKIKDKDGNWTGISYGPMNDSHAALGMVVASNNNVWFWSSRMNTQYVCVFNINGTPETDDDDLFMSSVSGYGSQSQCVGTFSLVDASSGEAVGTRATAVAIDANDNVWVGTTAGLLMTTDNSTMLSSGSVTFNRIKVPRNDGTNLADYLLDGQFIYDIKVDGANRKWIATSNGAYLVSSNGLETIQHFTAENSPLPNNTVNKIAIRPADGEVFFFTASGIVSYKGDANQPEAKLAKIKVYPNPISAMHGPGYVTLTGFENDSPIFITDASGNRVFRTRSLGGMARWDLRREAGSRVAPGVYIVWATNSDGSNEAVGKILLKD